MTRFQTINLRPHQWAVLALCAVIVGTYFPTFRFLDLKWSAGSQAYSHGYLIALICVFLLVRAAALVRPQCPPLPLMALLGLLLSNAIWLLAYLANTMIVQVMIIPVCAYFLHVTVFGRRSAMVWIMPVSYFYFAVPFWDYGNGILQAMTISVSTSILDAGGITAFIDGSFVYLARGTFEISAGCAGLHFFIVALALATLYAFLYLKNWHLRVLLVLIAALGSIVMNWIRVTTIIIAGHLSDMQHYLVTVDHYYFGWALFAVLLVPLFWVASRFEAHEASFAIPDQSADEPSYSDIWSPGEVRSLGIAMIVGVCVAAVLPITTYLIAHREASFPPRSIEIPPQLGGWTRSEDDSARLGIRFDGAQSSMAVRFRDGPDLVNVYVNNYARQSQGAELISSSNSIFDRSQWKTVARDRVDIRSDSGAVVSAIFLELSNRAGERRVLYYWFVVDGESFVDPVVVKMREVFALVAGKSSSGIRVVAQDCAENCESSRILIESFVREHIQELNCLNVSCGRN